MRKKTIDIIQGRQTYILTRHTVYYRCYRVHENSKDQAPLYWIHPPYCPHMHTLRGGRGGGRGLIVDRGVDLSIIQEDLHWTDGAALVSERDTVTLDKNILLIYTPLTCYIIHSKN